MNRIKAEKNIISLDIGNDSMKVIKGIRRDGKICILDFASQTFSAELSVPEALSRCVHDLVGSVTDIKRIKNVGTLLHA